MYTEIAEIISEKEKKCIPMDGTILNFYNKDYTDIFSLFNNSGLLVYPVYTPTTYNYGKAIIAKDDVSNIIAKYSYNGNLIVVNEEILNSAIKIKRLNGEQLSVNLKYLMDFFISIKLIKYYDTSIITKLKNNSEIEKITDLTYTVSNNADSLMNEIFGENKYRKNVNCSKTLKITKIAAIEMFSIDFLGYLKINIQPYADGVRYDFKFKKLNAYAIVKDNNYKNIDKLFKLITQDYLKKFKDVDLDIDYILTEDFFDFYKSLSLILNH